MRELMINDQMTPFPYFREDFGHKRPPFPQNCGHADFII